MNPEGESQVFLKPVPTNLFQGILCLFWYPSIRYIQVGDIYFFVLWDCIHQKKTLITISHFVETGVLFSNGNTPK